MIAFGSAIFALTVMNMSMDSMMDGMTGGAGGECRMAFGLDIKGLAGKKKLARRCERGRCGFSSCRSQCRRQATTKRNRGLPIKSRAKRRISFADLKPYLPSELIGGSIPYVPGTELESRLERCLASVRDGKGQSRLYDRRHACLVSRLPSSALASSPDSWCPLAAALPGNSEYWDKETVYLYEQEGLASALRWDPETGRIQIFLGAARTILPRIQSMDANFVTVNAQMATVVPWRNRQLMTEKLSRGTAHIARRRYPREPRDHGYHGRSVYYGELHRPPAWQG